MEFSCSKGLLLTFVGEFFVQPKTTHLQIGLQSSMNKTKKNSSTQENGLGLQILSLNSWLMVQGLTRTFFLLNFKNRKFINSRIIVVPCSAPVMII